MLTERIKDIEEIRLAMTVVCPICKADIGCACDQFTAPHSLPFTVHVERLGVAENRAMIGEFHRAAKTPGMILTHWEHAVDEGYWSESKFRIEADGSRTLLSQRTFKPEESDAN